jgi:L-histidine N-alpha-methyltransferase
LLEGAARLRSNLPRAQLRSFAGTHLDARPAIEALEGRQVLLFIGSSIGNYPDGEAVQLLAEVRRFLRADALLVLGADLVKEPQVMQRAYDDAQGVTAAFSKNILARLNRELQANFDVEAFQHIALWNEASSNIEVYLESRRAQRVQIGALQQELIFREGERIHTETCAKYDSRRIDRILSAAGFSRTATLVDSAELVAIHLAHVARRA